MNIHEHFLLTETKLKIKDGERRGQLEQALAEAQKVQPTLRERAATLLVALADRLSPEAVVAYEEAETFHHA